MSAEETSGQGSEVTHPMLGTLRWQGDSMLGEVDHDGQPIEVCVSPDGESPQEALAILTAEQFAAVPRLTGPGAIGSGMVELQYDDCGLFAGHMIVVESFDGSDFEDLNTSIFG